MLVFYKMRFTYFMWCASLRRQRTLFGRPQDALDFVQALALALLVLDPVISRSLATPHTEPRNFNGTYCVEDASYTHT